MHLVGGGLARPLELPGVVGEGLRGVVAKQSLCRGHTLGAFLDDDEVGLLHYRQWDTELQALQAQHAEEHRVVAVLLERLDDGHKLFAHGQGVPCVEGRFQEVDILLTEGGEAGVDTVQLQLVEEASRMVVPLPFVEERLCAIQQANFCMPLSTWSGLRWTGR